MTFVELVERLRVECAVSGPVVTTVQGTLPHKIQQLKNWIVTAWEEIQNRHEDWEFMRIPSSHTIAQYDSLLDPAEYTAESVANWKLDSFRLADSGEGFPESSPIAFVPYDIWVVTDGLDPVLYGRPLSITVRTKDKALFVGPTADAAYELYYDYYRTPQTLSADADVPICHSRFHMIIVYQAMMAYGFFESAPEVVARGKWNYFRTLALMQAEQLPMVYFSGMNSEAG